MKKKIFAPFALILLFVVVLVLNACVSMEQIKSSFILNESQNSDIVIGGYLGAFSGPEGTSEIHFPRPFRYELVSGNGSIDNDLFRIDGGNSLIARNTLDPTERLYSVRVMMLTRVQDGTSGGLQKVFTFTAAGGVSPFSDFQGIWSYEYEFGFRIRTTLRITGETINIQSGFAGENNYSFEYILIGASGNSFTLQNRSSNLGEIITLNIQIVNGNLVINNASEASWNGIYLKQN